MIEICTVGGYDEIGRNWTAIKVDDEVVVMDMGLLLDKYIVEVDDADVKNISAKRLLNIGAVPDIRHIEDWRKKVVAIIPTHAHLDHIGALPYLSSKYNAPIICTPFASAVLRTILRDDKKKIKNDIVELHPNSSYKISDKISIDFINMTHSTPQTVMVAIHTPYGTVVYANDFKFDSYPVLGKKPNFEKIKQVGKDGVVCLIVDSIYAKAERKTPSEQVARDMLQDVLMGTESEGKAIVITTFASHLARLKSIISFGKKMDRKVLLFGRSLAKYVSAGEEANVIDFSKDVKIYRFAHKMRKAFKNLKHPEKYLIVVTGHQGEKKAVLSRLARDQFDFKLRSGDHVIFSSQIIPSPVHVADRKILEDALKNRHVRVFKDIHVSGHASREDLRDLVNMLKPNHIIPAHCADEKAVAMCNLAVEEGYVQGESVHLMKNGQRISFE